MTPRYDEQGNELRVFAKDVSLSAECPVQLVLVTERLNRWPSLSWYREVSNLFLLTAMLCVSLTHPLAQQEAFRLRATTSIF